MGVWRVEGECYDNLRFHPHEVDVIEVKTVEKYSFHTSLVAHHRWGPYPFFRDVVYGIEIIFFFCGSFFLPDHQDKKFSFFQGVHYEAIARIFSGIEAQPNHPCSDNKSFDFLTLVNLPFLVSSAKPYGAPSGRG